MKKTKLSLAILILLLATAASVIIIVRREGVGKNDVDPKLLLALVGFQDRERANAEQNIREKGTNAIPSLLRALKTDYSPLHQSLSSWEMRQRWLPPLQGRFLWFRQPEFLRRAAVEGFRILGPAAKPALPGLEEALANPASAADAMTILTFSTEGGALIFGPRAYADLLNGLTNSNPTVQNTALRGLCTAQTNLEIIVPILLKCLRDPADQVRQIALVEISKTNYNVKSAEIISACIPLLSDKDSNIKVLTSYRLKSFGNEATNAISALDRLSKEDTDLSVRRVASNAIVEIRRKPQ